MSGGIRATLGFEHPESCPVSHLSTETGSVISGISTSVTTPNGREATSEFYLSYDEPPDNDRVEVLFSYGGTHLCRVSHGNGGCPCVSLGEFGIPISRFVAAEGSLTIVFHTFDYDELQTVIAALRDRHGSMSVKRLIRAPPEGTPNDTVFVNRGRLTARQLQVLNAAFEYGYFERPRRTNVTELADILNITPSTVSEHLRAAQSKLFQDVLGDG